MSKKRKKIMYVLEQKDDIIDFAEIYKKLKKRKNGKRVDV